MRLVGVMGEEVEGEGRVDGQRTKRNSEVERRWLYFSIGVGGAIVDLED
jgi:hypothetical protein